MTFGSAGTWQVLLFLCLWMPNSCGRQLQRVNIGVLTTQGDQDSPFDAVLAGRLHVRVAQLPSMSQNPLLFLNATRDPHNYTQEHLDVVATDLSVYSTPVQRFLLQQLAAPILIYPAPLSSSSGDHVTGQLRGSGGPSPSLSSKGSAWEGCVGLRPSSFSNSELPRIPSRHEVVESVIRAINSSHVIIIFDNEAENEASYVSACLANAGTLTRMVNVQRKVNVTSVFEYAAVQLKEKAQFLVLCSPPRVYRIIGLANAFDGPSMRSHALSRLSRWLLVLPPGHQTALETSSLVLDNVAVVTYPPEMQHHQEPLLQGLKLATKKIFAVLAKLQLPLSNKFLASEFVDRLFESLDWRSSCWRCDVRTLKWESGGRSLRHVGHVTLGGHVILDFALFPNARFGFNSRNLVVATLPWSPFVIRELTPNGTYSYKGYCIDLVNELASSLNFTYTLVEPEDHTWGILENRTWGGLVEMMQNRRADLMVAPLSIQNDREEVMDFTFPFFIDYSVVVVRQPDPSATRWLTLIQPFSMEVHVCIWLCLGVVGALLWGMELLNPFYKSVRTPSPQGVRVLSGDAFWYLLGALLNQGGETMPASQAGRTLVASWWLFSIVLAAAYGGNLIAYLTVAKNTSPFDSLQGMLRQSELIFGTAGGSYYIQLLQTSKDRVYQSLWRRMQLFQQGGLDVFNMDQMVHKARVQRGGYAYIGDKASIDNWVAEDCELQTIKELFFPLNYAMGLPNNSGHLALFSNELMRIYESGLLEIWQKNWWHNQRFCQGSLISEAERISLVDVQSAFYLVAIGVFLGGLALGGERLYRRYGRRHVSRP